MDGCSIFLEFVLLLFSLENQGDKVDNFRPLRLNFFINESEAEMHIYWWGAGMAPLRSHILPFISIHKETDRKVAYCYVRLDLKRIVLCRSLQKYRREEKTRFWRFHVVCVILSH